MRFRYLLISILLGITLISNVRAEEIYYLPERNTYYQRSQHAYSFYTLSGEWNTNYAPSIFVLLKNEEEAKILETWDFTEKYTIPWSMLNQTYQLVYCADIEASNDEFASYRKVPLKDSTFISEEAKEHLQGILENVYPYISVEDMKNNLVAQGVLEYKTVGENKFLTAKANENPTRDIAMDELVSATQVAIYNYTNPTTIDEMYVRTVELSGRSVLKLAGLWSNVYERGHYDEVENNIKAVYDYLITLTKKVDDTQRLVTIKNIDANKIEDSYEVKVVLGSDINDIADLKLQVLNNDGVVINEYPITDTQIDLSLTENPQNLTFKLAGLDQTFKEVEVFESLNGKEYSQTMVGLNYGTIETVYTSDVSIHEFNNPATGTKAIIGLALLVTGGLIIVLKKKKDKIYKIN